MHAEDYDDAFLVFLIQSAAAFCKGLFKISISAEQLKSIIIVVVLSEIGITLNMKISTTRCRYVSTSRSIPVTPALRKYEPGFNKILQSDQYTSFYIYEFFNYPSIA